MKTLRKEITELLETMPMTAKEISRSLGITEKEATNHLEHIRHSVKTEGKKLVITPAQCLGCGFKFSKRQKITSPGRCPECRSTHIQDPIFFIK